MTDIWLAKVRRYGGVGESVMASFEELGLAIQYVDGYNANYQTDAAYVEKYDAAKVNWPTKGTR